MRQLSEQRVLGLMLFKRMKQDKNPACPVKPVQFKIFNHMLEDSLTPKLLFAVNGKQIVEETLDKFSETKTNQPKF